MNSTTFLYKGKDNADIFAYKWLPEEGIEVKGIVQIAHGMAEYAGRYEHFAKALTDSGYIVYANDHRGHGNTAKGPEDLGFFAEKDGWDLIVEDVHLLSLIIKENHPQIPLFLFGHSMGSFITRSYIQRYKEELNGAILCGTGMKSKREIALGHAIASIQSKLIGKNKKSKLMDVLCFGKFSAQFYDKDTNFAWLTRDKEQVEKYVSDPLCGCICTTGFFCDLLTGLREVNDPNNIKKISKKLPVLIISGDGDPVGNNGKDIMKLFHLYKEVGIEDVSYKLYKEARHELLNETNKDEVIEDVINWLKIHGK
ncbi:alpha/beta hydrolase [Clostridium malenominatum]|uniref:Alpha/beta hydrolase n=1 Tax=Clostridium malenominatum TaxID=1539 RepID=A0ABN1J366_9CLOT